MTTARESVFNFLEKNQAYETITVIVILLNVIGFILATLFNEQYNPNPPFECGSICDAIWFGNDETNALSYLNIGSTSVLEIMTVCIFTVDYILRLWTADLEHESYKGIGGRIRYTLSFYPLVDLVSLAPFYVNSFVIRETDFEASFQWVRSLRLFRMLRVEGRYDLALGMLDDVFYEQRGVLGVALFVGATVWLGASSLYYIAERHNLDMIYCGAVPNDVCDSDAVDVSKCTIDDWGFVNCTLAGCPPTDEYPEPCYNLYRSIPSASYFTLLNLFGEFPMIDTHSFAGKIVGTLVAVIAVAVFALPAGIVGNGFEDVIARRREEDSDSKKEETQKTATLIAGSDSHRGKAYNFFHSRSSSNPAAGSGAFEYLTDALVVIAALSFMLDTVSLSDGKPLVTPFLSTVFDYVELVSAIIFSYQYIMQVYAIGENPEYSGLSGRIRYVTSFLPLVDLLSFLPFWIEVIQTGQLLRGDDTCTATVATFAIAVRCLRILRILRFDRYTNAFSSFDDVLRDSSDVLAMTGFTALVLWVFFSVLLYFSERNNYDEEVASYYRTVPHAMWVTLLNLSGESPLSNYTVVGKIATGVIGLFASGLFGIPIGVLGAGFEELVDDGDEEEEEKEEEEEGAKAAFKKHLGTGQEYACYCFVNGEGSKTAALFELLSHSLCLATVIIGIVQTVPGWENFLEQMEWIAVIFFTVEYALRTYGAPSDPEFGGEYFEGHIARMRFAVSFFSFVDLLGIAPFYFAVGFPNSWIARSDFYLRLFRIVRLIKLDKYFPSITLIDDVVRLKRKVLAVTGFAAITMWIIFAAFLYLAESSDTENAIDPVPIYGCGGADGPVTLKPHEEAVSGGSLLGRFMRKKEDAMASAHEYEGLECTMADRFQNFFDSMIYTGIHLTGDYPIITYSSTGRVICFFMVIVAVGIVAIPSGIIANSFAEIVQSKARARSGKKPARGNIGDDWYDIRYAALEGVQPPPSMLGPKFDQLQQNVNDFLNGKASTSNTVEWAPAASAFRKFMLGLIIVNIASVVLQSIPEIDRYVGNEYGNLFSALEGVSAIFFAIEYLLRLFSAPKCRQALFSTTVYATTFFGIVDFLSASPWFIRHYLLATGRIQLGSNNAKIFRIFRVARILEIEGFIIAFSKLDNVFRASKEVLKATGLMALIIWVICSSLFFIFEENNPNWRECDSSIPPYGSESLPGCYDFASTEACNEFYPGLCKQEAFTDIPNSLFYTAVFLVGEWGLVDFTWPGRIVCMFLCVAGIGLYAIPTGALFDSFGAVIGMGGDD